MRGRIDANRQPGELLSFRKYAVVPSEESVLAWVRVNILLKVLWRNEEIGQQVEDSFHQLGDSWAKNFSEITPEYLQLGSDIIKTFLLVDNPTLVPVLLDYYYHKAIVQESSTEAATFRNEALAHDPTPLGRPTDREGRAYYSGVHQRLREQVKSGDWEKVDIAALWRYAEVWVLVRHKLVESLPAFVDGLEKRPYVKRSEKRWGATLHDLAEFDTDLRKWRRALQQFDEALLWEDWPMSLT